jgi:excisionase family DNA binding protein
MACMMLTREVAEALRCSEETVRALVSEGRLKAQRVRPRGQLLFSPDDVQAALKTAGTQRIEAGRGST